jgi:uncharacterized membrane protein
MGRFVSIDVTRGVVMIIMALDHVREFIHKSAATLDPTNLQNTTALLFLTRWITHLCAPAFVFLAGMSAYISLQRKKEKHAARRFLLTRGLWLLILEFTFINFALWFDIRFRLLLMEVIAAIGLSFMVLALLIRLNSRLIGLLGLILILSGIFVQYLNAPETPSGSFIFSVLFRPGLTRLSDSHSFFTAYPLLPWLGIMLTGFATGEVYEFPPERRRKILLRAGALILLFFVVIRSVNTFGDPARWTVQSSYLFTALSFLNVTKYPPSMLFTILFLAITMIILSLTGEKNNSVSRILSVYGRVPLFFFVIHLFVIHALMFPVLFIQGYGAGDFVFGAFKNGRPEAGGGLGLAGVYLIWIAVVILLYPVCKWYGNYKASNPGKRILKYL